MKAVDEVLNGLACCFRGGDCLGCPYYPDHHPEVNDGCAKALIDDASEHLREYMATFQNSLFGAEEGK